MRERDADDAVGRLRLALEIFAAGEAIQRQNLRRHFPQASAEEIETRLIRWLSDRPGAENGDASGRLIHWPRRHP